MSNTIKGTKQPQQQGRAEVGGIVEADGGAGQPLVSTVLWEGPVAEVFGLLTPAFLSQYSRVSYRQNADNVTAQVRASFGGAGGTPDPDEVLLDEWELLGGGTTADLRHHDRYIALDESDKANIELFLREPERRLSQDPALVSTDGPAFWDLLKNGTDTFTRSYSILRNTLTTNNPFTINVAMSNIERLHTFNQLPVITNGGVLNAVANLADAGPPFTVPNYFAWRWLKQRPQISGAANGRAQITVEFWLYAWSTVVYPDAS